MDNLTFEKADALLYEIKKLQNKIKYFREPYEFCVMTYQEKEEIRKAKTFKAKLRIILKNEKPKVKVNYETFSGGVPIDVDKEFLEYCAKYFENKLKEKEEEFNNL